MNRLAGQQLLIDDFVQNPLEQLGIDVEGLALADQPLGHGLVRHVGLPHRLAVDPGHGHVARLGLAVGRRGAGHGADAQREHERGLDPDAHFRPLPHRRHPRAARSKALKGKAIALTGLEPVLKSRARTSRADFLTGSRISLALRFAA